MSEWLINPQTHPTDTSKTRKYHCYYLLWPFPQHKSQSFAQQLLHQHNFGLKYCTSFRKTSNCDLKTASLEEFITYPKQAVSMINCLHSSCIPHVHMGTENTKGKEPSFGPLAEGEEWISCQFYEVIITLYKKLDYLSGRSCAEFSTRWTFFLALWELFRLCFLLNTEMDLTSSTIFAQGTSTTVTMTLTISWLFSGHHTGLPAKQLGLKRQFLKLKETTMISESFSARALVPPE